MCLHCSPIFSKLINKSLWTQKNYYAIQTLRRWYINQVKMSQECPALQESHVSTLFRAILQTHTSGQGTFIHLPGLSPHRVTLYDDLTWCNQNATHRSNIMHSETHTLGYFTQTKNWHVLYSISKFSTPFSKKIINICI